jgi:hypothetical protein
VAALPLMVDAVAADGQSPSGFMRSQAIDALKMHFQQSSGLIFKDTLIVTPFVSFQSRPGWTLTLSGKHVEVLPAFVPR